MSFMLGTENGKGYFQLLSQGGLLVLAPLPGAPGLLRLVSWRAGQPGRRGELCHDLRLRKSREEAVLERLPL